MTEAIKMLEAWSTKNMTINTTKTTYQFFTMQHHTENIDLKMNDETLQETQTTTYLGINLDKKLTYKDQIEKMINKVNNKNNILKRLAGAKWGGTKDLLNKTYKSYIKPNLLYGGELLITANDNLLQKAEMAQSRSLRIITGAIKTTPIVAMQTLTENLSLKTDYKIKAILLAEKNQNKYL